MENSMPIKLNHFIFATALAVLPAIANADVKGLNSPLPVNCYSQCDSWYDACVGRLAMDGYDADEECPNKIGGFGTGVVLIGVNCMTAKMACMNEACGPDNNGTPPEDFEDFMKGLPLLPPACFDIESDSESNLPSF
jgi:hypothetical protein